MSDKPTNSIFNGEENESNTTVSETSKQKNHHIIGFIFVLLAALGFSAKAVLIKLAYLHSEQIDAITLMNLRMLIALPFFLLVALWNMKKNTEYTLHPKDHLKIIILGVMGYYLASLLDFTGLQFISAGLERIILFLYPTFVVLFSALIYKRTIQGKELIALGLSYSGMIIVFWDNMDSNSPQLLLGSVLILCSAITFALFIMGSAAMIKKVGSARFTAYSMIVACCATITHFLTSHDLQLLNIPADIYVLALIMAIFSTVMPAFFMNAGIRRIGAGKAAIISSTGPIGTLILAYFFLGELLTAAQISGTILVLIGIYVVSRAKSTPVIVRKNT